MMRGAFSRTNLVTQRIAGGHLTDEASQRIVESVSQLTTSMGRIATATRNCKPRDKPFCMCRFSLD